MKKYHQQKLAEHEADDVFWRHPCWEHGHDWRVSLWAAWATTGKSTLWLTRSLRDAYAVLTRMSGNNHPKHPLKITNVPSRKGIPMHRLPVTLCICPFLICWILKYMWVQRIFSVYKWSISIDMGKAWENHPYSNARQPEIDTKTMQVCWTEKQEGYCGPRKIKNPSGHVRLGCIIHTAT